MTPTAILALYIALVLLDLGWGIFLTALNYRNVRAHEAAVPEAFRGTVSIEEQRKASAYSLAKMRLGFVESPFMTALTLIAVATGLFGILDAGVAGFTTSVFLRGALFLGAVLFASAVLSTPFSLYATFSLERRFGFNTTGFRTWAIDTLKGAALSLVLGLPMLWILFAFMDAAGGLWWLWAASIFSLLSIVLSLVYPLLIAPLFNKFTPLPEGSLKDRIGELSDRLEFRTSGIFVMDGSKRSRHSNAYFTGLGAVKRIVLYDTLVSSMGEDEVLAVLAHEIGHEKKRHVLKMTAVSVLFSFLGFFALSLLMEWTALYAAFGFAAGEAEGGVVRQSREAILLIFGLISGPATFFLTPLLSLWSRRHEYEADRFAAQAVGAAPLASALLRLNRENASNLSPHPLYSFWYYSHPALAERLAAIGPDAVRQEAEGKKGKG